MSLPNIQIHDVGTGVVQNRKMTSAEYEAYWQGLEPTVLISLQESVIPLGGETLMLVELMSAYRHDGTREKLRRAEVIHLKIEGELLEVELDGAGEALISMEGDAGTYRIESAGYAGNVAILEVLNA